jgi:hypothetical protein
MFWAVVLVAALAVVIVTYIFTTHRPTDIEHQRLYLDAYKAIGIGFLVVLMGKIIPNLVFEGRDDFERAKESRVAYSQAKTSVIYLPGTLAVLDYGEAMAVVQKSHRKLHIAETYGKELSEYLEWYGDKIVWTDQVYWELTAVRRLLQSHADIWNNLKAGDRTNRVARILTDVEKLFGDRGADWQKLPKKERETRVDELIRSTIKELLDVTVARDLTVERLELADRVVGQGEQPPPV